MSSPHRGDRFAPFGPRAACAVLALLTGLAGCGGSPEPVSVAPDAVTDPAVREIIQRTRATAVANPASAAAHFDLGLALAANGLWLPAETSFRNAVAVDAKHAEAHYQIARALARQSETEGRVSALERAIALEPRNHAARYDLALAYLDSGDLDGAEKEFQRLEKLAPELFVGPLGLGLVASERGDDARAIEFLQKARAMQPSDQFVRFRLGRAYAAVGRDNEATGLLASVKGSTSRPTLKSPGTQRAERYDVGRSGRLARATGHLGRAEADEALALLRPLVESDATDVPAASALASAFLMKGQLAEARGVLDKALAVEPAQSTLLVQKANCFLLASNNASEAGQRDAALSLRLEALTLVDQALSTDAGSAKGHRTRGILLGLLERPHEALPAFRRAIELGDAGTDTYIAMMPAAVRAGGAQGGLDVLEEGLATGGDPLRLRHMLCGVLLAAGEGTRARVIQQQMAAAAPDHPMTAEMDRTLAGRGF